MPMTLGAFLSPLGKLKDIEIVSKEQFSILNNLQIDSPEYDLKLSDWLFYELRLISGLKKLKEKLNKSIQTKHYLQTEILSLNSIDDVYNWIETLNFESESDEISDLLICKLDKDFSNIYNVFLNHFYNNKLILLKINSASIQKLLYTKMQAIEKKSEKEIFKDFIKYLKDFYANVEHQVKIDESDTETIIYESTRTLLKVIEWHPFHNDTVRDFHLHLESKYSCDNKIEFSAFWKFFKQHGLIDVKEEKRIRHQYFKWINERFNFHGEKAITKLQTNTSSFDFGSLEKHLEYFESSKDINFQFHDFREEGISRTTKKPSSK